MTKLPFFSRRANGIVLLIGAVAAAGSLGACGTAADGGAEQHGSHGRIELGLLGTAPSGTVYRLVAEFHILGAVDATLDGSIDATSLSTEVPVGTYEVSLLDGWALERITEEGDSEAVEAQLVSANPRFVQVDAQSVSHVRFDFLVGDDPISVGNGVLDIGIDVQEGASAFAVGDGGYVTSGAWRGLAFADAAGESTISPADFEDHLAGEPLCVSGAVAPQEDWGGYALLGFALDQEQDPDSELGVVLPTGSGVAYDITANVASPLRIQIQGPNGVTDPDDRWCAIVTAGSGVVPWGAFNTTCWDAMGSAYAGEPLAHGMVLVPGDAFVDVPFDFCLNSLGAAD